VQFAKEPYVFPQFYFSVDAVMFSKISRFGIIQKQDYKMALRKYRKALRYLDVCWEKEEIDEGESLLGII
jgi:hypothetical protein